MYTIDDFIDGNCYTKKIKQTGKSYCIYSIRCVGSVQQVCARMAAILKIETFVTFDFEPSLFQD